MHYNRPEDVTRTDVTLMMESSKKRKKNSGNNSAR